MIGWLKLSDEQRKTSLEQAAARSGITVKAIEKDWWVTLTLKALFTGKYKEHLIFKGGTSLSKCWRLIERFSEDIDIALDPEVLGFKYVDAPSKSYVERLRKAGCAFISTTFRDDLEAQFNVLGVPSTTVKIEAVEVPPDRTDTDPQTILIKYASLFDLNPYLADMVKIEVSVRSMREPFGTASVQSILNEVFPNDIYGENPFELIATEPQRTFLEKTFLLHEEFAKEDTARIRFERMSRHLYDLERMLKKEIGHAALANTDLYQVIVKHRRYYTPIRQFDYDTLHPDRISFIPPDAILEAYKKDYAVMREQMIYGDAPEFDALLATLKELLEKFRSIKL
jgi:hypothetical protein